MYFPGDVMGWSIYSLTVAFPGHTLTPLCYGH